MRVKTLLIFFGQRVTVRAIKEFSHPGGDEALPVDLNRSIETTVAISRNEWKYVAEVELRLDDTLPMVPCLQGEFNQAMLNLIVNAIHAIAGVVGDGTSGKGKITIATRCLPDSVEFSVADTGTGIAPEIRSRIFEPFLTTKPFGKGTGQGLALVYATIVKKAERQTVVRIGRRSWNDLLHPPPTKIPWNTTTQLTRIRTGINRRKTENVQSCPRFASVFWTLTWVPHDRY